MDFFLKRSRWRESGPSVAELCRRERVIQLSFVVWRRRPADEALAAAGDTARTFLPVEIVGESPLTATGQERELPVGARHRYTTSPVIRRAAAYLSKAVNQSGGWRVFFSECEASGRRPVTFVVV